jgi:hypothetical protein
MHRIQELVAWARDLDPAAAFLMLLPFVVGAAGLLQYWLEHRGEEQARRSARPVLKP